MNKKVVFLPYDFDTALGINNEGTLAFGYNLEDTDVVSGANVYNGQDSVLWNNLRELFASEIKTAYQQLRSNGELSYQKVEQMFEDHQNKWPEAIFNEDAQAKYLDPLETDGDETYLPMLQGSKAEQRKWWLYNRFRYIDSKYNAGDALTDYIDLRGYAKANITVTPYADVYATVKYGSYLVQQRGTRNQAYTLVCPLDNLNDTEIQIFSASQLSDVGDLSGLKVGRAVFSSATKLVNIKLGDSDVNYDNPNLGTLSLGNNKLLKKIDVRNCSGLGDTSIEGHTQRNVDLSGCTGIEEVYFDGTKIAGVSLPNGGWLKKLHLPGTITNLTIRNQTGITEFVCPDLTNVSSLWIENPASVINTQNIVGGLAAGSRVRLIGFSWNFNTAADMMDYFDMMDTMRGLDQNGNNMEHAQLYGSVYVPTVTGAQIASVRSRYPDISYTYDTLTATITFMNGNTVYATQTVNNGGDATNPSGTPTKAQDAQYTYTFAGWSLTDGGTADPNALKAVVEDRTVYAAYTSTVRTYTVTFTNSNGTVLQTVNNVPYGGTATYTGATPIHPTDPDNNVFQNFSPTGENITGNTTCVAVYKDTSSKTRALITREIRNVEDDELTSISDFVFFNCWELTTASFPSVTSIGISAFFGCRKLTTVSFPLATSIEKDAFNNCESLTAASFPSVTAVGNGAFAGCKLLTTALFPLATTIGSEAFTGCSNLTTVSIPLLSTIRNYVFNYCLNLVTMSFSLVTYIGINAFTSCSNLTTVSFPLLKSIANSAFYNCIKLTTVSFPLLDYISDYAFCNCKKLTTIILPSSSVVSLRASTAFTGTNSSMAIYVPDNIISNYISATNWSYFSSRIKGISELPT